MSLDYDRLDHISKRMPCSEVEVVASRLSYTDLCQLFAELDGRIAVISDQIEQCVRRDDDWRHRVERALLVNQAKREIVRRRLDDVRASVVDTLMAKLGGNNDEIVLMRCLLNVIDHHVNLGWISDSEQVAIDVARGLSGYSTHVA